MRSFYKGTNPIMGLHPHDLIASQTPLPSSTMTLKVRICTLICRRHKYSVPISVPTWAMTEPAPGQPRGCWVRWLSQAKPGRYCHSGTRLQEMLAGRGSQL